MVSRIYSKTRCGKVVEPGKPDPIPTPYEVLEDKNQTNVTVPVIVGQKETSNTGRSPTKPELFNVILGQELDFDFNPTKNIDIKFKVELVNKVLNQRYYFNTKYYQYLRDTRIIRTLDDKVRVKLNFNVMLVNPRWLYFIISVCQLNLLNFINEEDTETVIRLVAEYLSLKCNISFRVQTIRGRIIRTVGNKIVERIDIDLTSTSFSSELEILLARANIILTKDGFCSGSALPQYPGL